MYQIFYGMAIKPFENTIDTSLFFSSHVHKKAWEFLLEGLLSNEVFLLIVGEYGVGKTLLCSCIVEHIKNDPNMNIVYVPHPNFSYQGILKLLLRVIDPSLNFSSTEEAQDFIIQSFQNNPEQKQIIIVMDDVQDMDVVTTLPKLLSFGKTITHERPVIRIVMFAHPKFLNLLSFPEMEAYNQRIRYRYMLRPFDLKQTKEYIYFRMVKAGARGVPRFDEGAITLIHQHSKGIPRLINNICEFSLRLGAELKATIISEAIVKQAMEMILPTQVFKKIEYTPRETSRPDIPNHLWSESPPQQASITKRYIEVGKEPQINEKDAPTVERDMDFTQATIKKKEGKGKTSAYVVFLIIIGILLGILAYIIYMKN